MTKNKTLVTILLLAVSTAVFSNAISIDYKTQGFLRNVSQPDRTTYFTLHDVNKHPYIQIIDCKDQLVLSKKVGKKNLNTSIDVSAFNNEIYFTSINSSTAIRFLKE